ncbi:PAS domain S-box protein [Mucilaginibacter pocheonensis]|uniref:PAS domain S-box-containing protein n=1 Tax=Mucilaginibacter pocheonensis TaxID=398050 RepID=A0ABU1T4G8_9SPHI|nr:PAS domain S-box protein [Mucilaginibacter pocheonensis]MDR6940204.1 PAS domain S-box-containing protein [Mucilaginibacter pocheonensis]
MPENINNKLVAWGFEADSHAIAMLAYWDRELVCRYANQLYIEWFGKRRDEMIDKIKMQDLFGELFYNNLPYITGVLEGRIQRFELDIKVPSGETRTAVATYSPDYENGEVRGFFVHIEDVTKHFDRKPYNQLNIQHDYDSETDFGGKILEEVTGTLKASLLTGFPGITKLSKQHYISESKLKRDFKAKFNSSIFSYYRNLQMALAEKYLEEKKCSKKQLAIIFNFSNPSNFSACYKRYLSTKSANNLIENIQKATDEQYKTFVSQAPFAIAMLDTEMKYLAFSNKWITDYNYDEAKLAGTIHEGIFPELKSKFDDIYKTALNGKINKCDEELIERADGSKVWIKWDIRPWYNYKNVIGGLLICTEDISALKLKDLENIRILEILNKTNEIARIGTWNKNFKKNAATWSKITKEILEAPENADPASSINLNLYKEGKSRDLVKETFNKAFENGLPFDIEVDLITFKGNLKRVRVIGYPEVLNGTCEAIAGIFHDITNFHNFKNKK